MINYVYIRTDQNISGIKTLNSLTLCSVILLTSNQLINKNYTDITFPTLSGMINYVNISTDQNISGIKTFNSLPLCSVIPLISTQLINKNNTDVLFRHYQE